MRLSAIETIALLFTGLAASASAAQTYITFQQRDDLAQAIIFGQRIDACSEMLAAVAPLGDGATQERRARIAAGGAGTRLAYVSADYFLGGSPTDVRQRAGVVVSAYRRAATRFLITMPDAAAERTTFFDAAFARLTRAGEQTPREDFVRFLSDIDENISGLIDDCRALV